MNMLLQTKIKMISANNIRQLLEVKQLFQWQLATAFENDVPIYSKIE